MRIGWGCKRGGRVLGQLSVVAVLAALVRRRPGRSCLTCLRCPLGAAVPSGTTCVDLSAHTPTFRQWKPR